MSSSSRTVHPSLLKLGKLYSRLELEEYLASVSRQFSVPTQVIVSEPGIVVPTQGRIYITHLLGFRGKIGLWESIRGTNMSPEDVLTAIFAVECYEASDDRGHFDGYSQQGLILAPEWYLTANPNLWNMGRWNDDGLNIPMTPPTLNMCQ